MRSTWIVLLLSGVVFAGEPQMPKSSDGKLETYAKEAKFYTYSMAYQKRDVRLGIAGVHSPAYNISASQPREPFGNGNKEFPWAHPAMTSGETKSIKFIHKGLGISIWSQDTAGQVGSLGARYQDTSALWFWQFAPGTTFGELLAFDDGTVWEVRTRTKGDDGKWHPQVYRPFRTPAELEKASGVRIPVDNITAGSLTATNGSSVSVKGYEHELPEIPNAKKLLQTSTFKPVLGFPWLNGEKVVHGYKGGGLTPAKYRGGLLEVSRKSCMRCHEDVGKNVNDFDQRRDWYGHVRGSDGIFSWHPFTEESISPNGFHRTPVLR